MLFGKGQLLDADKYFIILAGRHRPRQIQQAERRAARALSPVRLPGHGGRAARAGHQGLQVDHLRLVMGTSMGCMHTFMWGENYPDFMDALMPLACLPVQIAGRNRLWRDAASSRRFARIRNGCRATTRREPLGALRTAAGLLLIAGSAPIQMQLTLPTRDAADEFLEKYMQRQLDDLDANDFLYQVNASRDYDPSPGSGEDQGAPDCRSTRRMISSTRRNSASRNAKSSA